MNVKGNFDNHWPDFNESNLASLIASLFAILLYVFHIFFYLICTRVITF